MKIWKRTAASVLALAVIAPLAPCPRAAGPVSASVSRESILFDGSPHTLSACNIEGSNYFMLRELAALLDGSAAQFSIETDAASYTIHLTTGGPAASEENAAPTEAPAVSEENAAPTEDPAVSEESAAPTAESAAPEENTAPAAEPVAPETGTVQAEPSRWKLTVNGSAVPVSAYTVGGFNFFKLRDLGSAVGFSVSYDTVQKQVAVRSEAPVFSAEIPACPAVAPEWFDDAAFVGDSVSGWLSFYAGDKGLGGAAFLTATSLGIENALRPVSGSSVHPSYQGTKMKVEDAVARCGAKKVYILLGMNDISYGVEKVTADYRTLLGNIEAAVPGVQIYVQSVMPMLSTSRRADSRLNNATIQAFNDTMRVACQENGWYYLDVASVFRDETGGMRADACADASGMGLHVTHGATAEWVDYLRTHVPVE